MDNKINILLVEDNPGDARLFREMLGEIQDTRFNIEHVETLGDGLKSLLKGNIDIVLLDLSLPDGDGLELFQKAQTEAPDVPFIVLTGTDDEQMASNVVHQGAQDYLIKGQVDGPLLARSIRYAIERNRLQQELRSMSWTDSLTGLNNRRGFSTLATQMLALADRRHEAALLFVIDMDGLKQVNDNHGHAEGDIALQGISEALRGTFRRSDVVGRLGGDEFAIFLMGARAGACEVIKQVLFDQVDQWNERMHKPYELMISVGIAIYDPDKPCTMDALMERADSLMYIAKQGKQGKKPDKKS